MEANIIGGLRCVVLVHVFILPLMLGVGDGGAYPECHVAPYPLNMGKKKVSSSVVFCRDM